MKKYIIANVKMNQNVKETKDYLLNFLPKIKDTAAKVAICFPYTSLAVAKEFCEGTSLIIGAQNVSEHEKGSYTGEISAEMLKNLGVSLVIIGHSERRRYFKEDNRLINNKIKRALAHGLQVVFCYGETKWQRTSGKTLEIIKIQIEEALSGLYENELNNIILAYEPIWAIGTGNGATVKQIEEVAEKTRSIVKQLFSKGASEKVTVIYGGSITLKNAKEYINAIGINGALVGGASLNPEAFACIVKLK